MTVRPQKVGTTDPDTGAANHEKVHPMHRGSTAMTRRQKVAVVVLTAALAVVAAVTVGINAVAGDDGAGESPSVDYEQWKTELHDLAGPIDFTTVRGVYERVCGETNDQFELFTAMQADAGMLDQHRLNTRHACPEKLPVIEDQQAGYRDFERICAEGARNEYERQLATLC